MILARPHHRDRTLLAIMRMRRAWLAGCFSLVSAVLAPVATAAELLSRIANLRFTYPDSWVLVSDGSRGGPITVATTGDAYLGNAAGVRTGGAIISILVPPPQRTEALDRVVFEDAPTIKNLVVTPGRSDAPGRLEYEDESAGPDAVTKNVRVYRRLGTRIIVVTLECNLNDPRIGEFLQIHSGVVESLAALAQ